MSTRHLCSGWGVWTGCGHRLPAETQTGRVMISVRYGKGPLSLGKEGKTLRKESSASEKDVEGERERKEPTKCRSLSPKVT